MPRLPELIGRFVLGLLIGTTLHYFFWQTYLQPVFAAVPWLLSPFTDANLTLQAIGNQGFSVTYPGIPAPLPFRYNLYSITLNLIFVPALVLATSRHWRWLGLQLLGAVMVMMGLHALQLASIMLMHLTSQPNPLLSQQTMAHFAGSAQWLYGLLDKMGYTLFPFLAWILVSGFELGAQKKALAHE